MRRRCYGDLTIEIDSDLLKSARLEAESRETTLDQMFSDYVASVVHESEHTEDKHNTDHEENRRKLLELMYRSPLGDLGKLPTREEIYAERMTWPRS